MVPLALIELGFGVAGFLTFLVAAYWGITQREYRRGLRVGAFAVLWLAAVLLNGWRNALIMAVAMVTLTLVWFLTQYSVESARQ